MLYNIFKKIQQFFAKNDYQSNLDEFISRHHPTSVCDVEHLISVYDREKLYGSVVTYNYK